VLALLFNQSSNVSVALTGVAAAPAIGATRIDVDFAITGAAASPAIGTGSTVLQAVAQSHGAGGGRAWAPLHSWRRSGQTVRTDFITRVFGTGVAASPAIGEGTVEITVASEPAGAPARSALASGIGNGEIITVVDLTDDEILLLLLMA
jgi:hypothetical protein